MLFQTAGEVGGDPDVRPRQSGGDDQVDGPLGRRLGLGSSAALSAAERGGGGSRRLRRRLLVVDRFLDRGG